DASDVVLSDTIDSHTNMVSVTTDTGTANFTAGVDAFSVNIGTLVGVDGTATITVTVTVDDPIDAGVEDVRNSGVVTGSNFTDVPSNEVVTPITAAPDLVITKTDGDATTVPGGVVIYTLTYNNVGDQDATGVVITETVPDYSTFNAAASTAGWSCVGTACTYIVGDLAAGGAAQTVNFAVTVDPTLPSGVDELYNPTSIDDDHNNGTDPTPSDNSDDDTTPITANPELSVTKDDGVTSTTPGSTLTYTISYSNYGNQTADNVVLTETIPDETLFTTTGSTSGWICTATTCTLNLGSLDPGDTGSATFVVIVDNPVPSGVETIYNYVAIEDDHTNGDETNLTDNSADDTDTLDAYPDLRVTKDDGQDQVAAGNQLTYTVVVENVGSQDATGIVITDTLPNYTTFVSASSSGVESPTGTVTWLAASLASGASATFTVTVNIDAELDPSVTSLTNTVTVIDDGTNGADPTPADNTDYDTDVVREAEKYVYGSNQAWTNPPQVAIGEIITYQASITVAAGASLPGLVFEDTMGQGLAFVDCVEIVSDPAGAIIPTPATGTAFSTVCGSPTIGTYPSGSTNPADGGRSIRFSFGGVTNSTGSDATLIIRYRVAVLDSAENIRDVPLTNNAEWQWAGNVIPVVSDTVTIVEPDLDLVKEVDSTVLFPSGTVMYTITMSHSDVSNSDAYDVILTDPIPDGLVYVPSSLTSVSGAVPDEMTVIPTGATTSSIHIRWDTFPNDGVNAVITFEVSAGYVLPGRSYVNTANVAWTSLPGDVSSPQTGNNLLSTERFYDPASSVDIYGTNASVSIGVPALPDTGFAPNRITEIPVQNDADQYTDTNNLHIEIPELNINAPIVGVPFNNGEWDLTWLGSQAGWLEGTSYPTWNGNSAITAHVYDANGQPGLFVNLGTLSYGDQVIVHAYGQRYIYEVRSNMRVLSEDLDVLEHEENSWITLITCQGYNAQANTYTWRTVVQAVLLRVEADTSGN
ncbi:MAG TPA: sortase, partial [Longilinea sp.]|nr:sortase [Longilinea sp.]